MTRTDLCQSLGHSYAKAGVAVQHGDADLQFGDLAIEVPGQQGLPRDCAVGGDIDLPERGKQSEFGLWRSRRPWVRSRPTVSFAQDMTIVSHTHRFIYIKPRKVASSSLLMALGRRCSHPDIVTSPGNTEGLPNYAMNSEGFWTHMHPILIRTAVSPPVFDAYLKVTAVRNPWDTLVSMLFWRLSQAKRPWGQAPSAGYREAIAGARLDPSDPEHHTLLLSCMDGLRRNLRFLFDPDGEPYADVHLRYETLQDDFDALCDRLGLERGGLPRLKGLSRPQKTHYRDYYDETLRRAVAPLAQPIADRFGYCF